MCVCDRERERERERKREREREREGERESVCVCMYMCVCLCVCMRARGHERVCAHSVSVRVNHLQDTTTKFTRLDIHRDMTVVTDLRIY